eukprot:TRINITY_DN5481_c0_g2_i1.p1 TRINITY_DN5481_c0_g2~~TRINITY_DN5481_c0_g2_i1.p1  ORF type:complete len:348 (+),score=86.03 TRINITY_DN5481_c0_g2_i1:34-1077(+)
MAEPVLERLAHNITCHAFNADRTQIAICPNNNQVIIYKKTAGGWEKEATLKEHDKTVTGIDWAPKTNRIVTCSEDRNAFVWSLQSGTWKPTLVILRVNRAATAVKWSPQENKFAVASGAKVVSVCYFEEDNDWWVSKHLKKHRSTVLSVAWHPNNVLLATGSSDFKARVFSAFIKGTDTKGGESIWGDKLEFGNALVEFDSLGWVHDVSFSPSGNRLAWTSHNSTLSVADGPATVKEVKLTKLPLSNIGFLNEDTVVGAGWDCEPFTFTAAKGWALDRSLDTKTSSEGDKTVKGQWQDRVTKGTTDSDLTNTILKTKHQNAICGLRILSPNTFTTCSIDGNVAWWKV